MAGIDKLDKRNLNYIDSNTHTGFLKCSILQVNDILIAIAGTLERTAIVRNEDLHLNTDQAVAIIRLVDSRNLSLIYLLCALNAPLIQKYLTTQKNITAIPNLSWKIISDFLLPIPPLAEQERIVTKYKELLPKIYLLNFYNSLIMKNLPLCLKKEAKISLYNYLLF